jgi:hypothetical protein
MPGWIECYTGPPELAEAVAGEGGVSVQGLSEGVRELTDRVRDERLEPDRQQWLMAQLDAIATALRWLAGERLEYATRFERCHGAPVGLVGDRQFEQAHGILDRALPGRGEVAARYRAWLQTQLVGVERLPAAIESLSDEMRRRSRETFGLPSGEEVAWELVSGEPWAGNAGYLGRRRSLIRINVDFPISSVRLLELVCHEAYPGHHCEYACKDAGLIGPERREELSVYAYPTPQALVSEGLASYALEALLGDEAERIAADCLRSVGIAYDDVTGAAVREAETLLLPVRSNIALMLDSGATSAQAHEYAKTWLLDDPEQIDEAIDLLETRSWLPYESCYPVGLALCRAYAGADPSRFRELLERQLTPGDLSR